VNHYNGTPIAAENIYRPILEREQGTSGNGSLHNGSETSEAESSQGSEMTAE
jgi:hypothetical protein